MLKTTSVLQGGVTADYAKSVIAEQRVSTVSAMPMVQDRMTLHELVDLVDYLTTLK